MFCQTFHFAILTELQHHQFEPSARKHACLNVLPEGSFCNSYRTKASSIWAICQKAYLLECFARSLILQFSWQSHSYSIINLSHLPESMLAWMFCQTFHFAILTELQHHQFEPSARKHACLNVLPEGSFCNSYRTKASSIWAICQKAYLLECSARSSFCTSLKDHKTEATIWEASHKKHYCNNNNNHTYA
jgi:hypothetical protein